MKTIAASRTLTQMIGEGRIRNLQPNKHHGWGRGFVWYGDRWFSDSETHRDIEERIHIAKMREEEEKAEHRWIGTKRA
jgi:hypothetical protein